MIKINDDVIYGTCDLHPETLKKSICMEECGELIQVISKCQRDRGFDPTVPRWARNISMSMEHHDNECEEIADVLLCIKMLMYLDCHTEEEIQWWIDYKQSRQMVRDYALIRKQNALEFEQGLDPEDFLDDEDLYYYKMCEKEYENAKERDAKEDQKPISNE